MNNILIVEDNELNLDMLFRRLQRKGFICIAAKNGAIGVEIAREQKPDLILMDMNMPVMDGFEATRTIREADEIKETPIIALTAYAQKEDEKRVLDAGCDEYMAKPIDFKTLLSKIEKYGLKPSK